MSKKYLFEDEWYPIYLLVPIDPRLNGEEFEVPDELIKRYEACMIEFTDVQDELQNIFLGKDK